MWIFRPSKLHPKKVSENNVDFSAREITPKKIHGKQQVFRTSKLRKNVIMFFFKQEWLKISIVQ